MVGGGICGLGAALLLARDGHEVTVLEKDDDPIPRSVDDCWDAWDRRGVAQFRQPHNFMPGMRLLLEDELPDVQEAMVDAGAARFDMVYPMPSWLRDSGPQPIDDKLWSHAIRRPTGEWVFLHSVLQEANIRWRQGISVTGLTTGTPVHVGIPHVTGVRTSDGDEIKADLVIDSSGRGSRGSSWLTDIDAHAPQESAVAGHFTYVTRYFEGPDPERLAPVLSELGSLSILCLPGERRTWSTTLFVSSNDPLARLLRRESAYMRVVRAHPLHAHWVEGTPISDVLVMGGVVDRCRRLATDDGPVVTGFVAIADAWACSNPSAGRGMTVGMLHAQRLRDVLRRFPDDPWNLVKEFDEITERDLRPWYDAQVASDGLRFAAMEAARTGQRPPTPSDPLTRDIALLRTGMLANGDLFRLGLEYLGTLASAQDIMNRPGVRARMQESVAQFANDPPPAMPAPSREQLLELAS